MRHERIETPPDHQFTYEYVQPEAYHFCLDSVVAPNLIGRELRALPIDGSHRALDLCAGCGVMGLELAHHEPRLRQMDFLEIQPTFAPYLRRNIEIAGHDPERFRLRLASFAVLNDEQERESYDFIVCNPPYFEPGEGKMPPDETRRRCRFFIDGSFDELILGIVNALTPRGHAYVLMRSGENHGRDAVERSRQLVSRSPGSDTHVKSWNPQRRWKVEPIADIRGTCLVRFSAR